MSWRRDAGDNSNGEEVAFGGEATRINILDEIECKDRGMTEMEKGGRDECRVEV